MRKTFCFKCFLRKNDAVPAPMSAQGHSSPGPRKRPQTKHRCGPKIHHSLHGKAANRNTLIPLAHVLKIPALPMKRQGLSLSCLLLRTMLHLIHLSGAYPMHSFMMFNLFEFKYDSFIVTCHTGSVKAGFTTDYPETPSPSVPAIPLHRSPGPA